MYDLSQGVEELMPYAESVSAKSYDFDAICNEMTLDIARLMKIVLDHDNDGYVRIEHEAPRLTEPEGIRATKALLERVRAKIKA